MPRSNQILILSRSDQIYFRSDQIYFEYDQIYFRSDHIYFGSDQIYFRSRQNGLGKRPMWEVQLARYLMCCTQVGSGCILVLPRWLSLPIFRPVFVRHGPDSSLGLPWPWNCTYSFLCPSKKKDKEKFKWGYSGPPV